MLYKYFEEYGTVILILVYPKTAKENITPAEKAAMKKAVEKIEFELKN